MSIPLAVPVQGPVALRLPFSEHSASEVRYVLTRWLTFLGADEATIDDARLVVTELVGNAVRHASPLRDGTLLIRWHRDDAGLVLSVCDGGGPTTPTLGEAGLLEERGRGLALVAAVSVRWWVEQRLRARSVHARLPLV